jgi:hypothetical protein
LNPDSPGVLGNKFIAQGVLVTDVDVSLAERGLIRSQARRLQIGCWIALIAIAIVRAWFTRYEFDGDAVSYLDIARAIAEGHPATAVSAYWSPGYPVLLSPFLWLFRPNAYWECPLAHFANVLILAGTLASFHLFWSEVRLWHKNYAGEYTSEIPEGAFWALGYSIFAIATLNLITVGLVHPDLLMAAFCCLAGWTVLRFRRKPGIGRALLLGLVLALGYYAKAPFFPMGIVFILCACIGWPVSRRTILLGVTALITFLLISAPFIAALSLTKGRLTFGDAARLAYAFYIDGVQHYQHWQGGPPGSGMPIHPTRKLNNYPAIYEFTAKDMGTYPPWFDPVYWNEGTTPHLNRKLQTKVFVTNLILEFQIIVDSAAGLVCAAIVLAMLASHHRRWTAGFRHLWFIWGPGTVALLMFALIHVEPRFLGGWLVMLFAGAVCACSLPAGDGTRRAVECIGLAALITAGAVLAVQTSQEVLGVDHAAGRSSRNPLIANFLLNSGLHTGDRVAVIGYGTEAYWAHLARLHVVAEIPAHITSDQTRPALDFWESGTEQQQKALSILEQTGADAVVAGSQLSLEGSVPSVVPAPWKKIDGTDACVYFFHANP